MSDPTDTTPPPSDPIDTSPRTAGFAAPTAGVEDFPNMPTLRTLLMKK